MQPSHLQESEQVQEPPGGGGAQEGLEHGVGPGLKGDGVPSLNALWDIAMPILQEIQNGK